MNKSSETRRRDLEASKAKFRKEREDWKHLKESLRQIANDETAKSEIRLKAIEILEKHQYD